ncbi:ATPase family protein 2 homolog [Dreissena polymorpha]|uniref:AAA ATPase AAA+ lid domain-containing protein n=1 Tax=Dreissena polymorpha TaxID=45954 RepID=A0A9D4K6V5_DREPO|nr:ATPase family protein 2 homolog [Dreissena polymorpha]KAH3834200.1 hypothetical protein DPMN_107519 [Dreissena polymorpha]
MPTAHDVTPDSLADHTDGYSGAEVVSVCHEAALFALQEDISSICVRWGHFRSALAAVTPRTGADMNATSRNLAYSLYEVDHVQNC